ncbi:coagulation factor 5/8 type domain-containing protein [Acidipila sp. EB88]|nr:coagulation factor 5/8 type domain-containing protein [Acidipila sp. EB88]
MTGHVLSSLAATHAAEPDFGPNVLIFKPSMSANAMQRQIDAVYATQQHNEFGPQRNAFLFLPGQYKLDLPIGFYTQVLGLGDSPDAVRIEGNVHADASAPNNNATTTFWRAAEGFSVLPTGGTMQWAVSQAVPMRRMHVLGNLVLHQKHGWASGGWMADTKVDRNVDSGTQQQWISRNSEWGDWTGSNWNMVFVGDTHMPEGSWPEPPYTKVDTVPTMAEKPFLTADAAGHFAVRVPALQQNSVGVTWHSGSTPGATIPIAKFYIAHAAADTAKSLNAQLAQGRHLLLTPGTYDLDAPLRITRAGTIVLGLGFATLHPVHGTAALTTADVDGINLSGLLVDAGAMLSPVLVQIGPRGSHARHEHDPVTLHDVFFRVGGAGVGRADINLEINSNDALLDHTWIWRADHGRGVGWDINTSQNGLVVNGRNVTAYGLFVEHHQHFQVLWNGEGGRTYFYQSEIPYDPPIQGAYSSATGVDGWASYKVADNVRQHSAWGLGVYSVFTHPDVALSRAIETPASSDIHFRDMITVALGKQGVIKNVINDRGGPTGMEPRVTPKVTSYP